MAERFVTEGISVVLVDIDEELDSVAAELEWPDRLRGPWAPGG